MNYEEGVGTWRRWIKSMLGWEPSHTLREGVEFVKVARADGGTATFPGDMKVRGFDQDEFAEIEREWKQSKLTV